MRSIARVVIGTFVALALQAGTEPFDADEAAATIVERYVVASEAQKVQLRGASMEVDIEASLPKLKKQGKLHALRQISRLGLITYNALGFVGDNTVKKEIIARYLNAEAEAQQGTTPPITPANYKFKYKGISDRGGRQVYVIQLTPRKKAVGLFKGELWLDIDTALPVREAGRFVKNPSVFVKRFEFVREYDIHDGVAIPRHSSGFVDTRLWGRAELSIDFKNFTWAAQQAYLPSEIQQ